MYFKWLDGRVIDLRGNVKKIEYYGEKMKLSDAIAQYLASRDIDTVFGYQGGSITHMIDSFDKYGIKYIQSYHEQGAGLAADAYARISKIGIGIAIGTNGPGVTNLITAIANAYCDSVPVLFFTGQVHTFAMKKSMDVRQESFQEIDVLSMVKTITKYAVTIKDKNRAIDEIRKAINIALTGRKGPVVIDLPVDIQGQDVEYSIDKNNEFKENVKHKDIDISSIIDKILHSKRPLIIAGGGIRAAQACDKFRGLICKYNIPVVTSLMGLDVMPHNDANFVGFIGSYGNRYANYAIQNADVILVLGSRLDMRQTGKNRNLFACQACIIHVDIDETELGHFIENEIQIKSDIGEFIKQLDKELSGKKMPDIIEWKQQINVWKSFYRSNKEFNREIEINPNIYIEAIGENIKGNATITFDVGQNQMWAAQSLRVKGSDIRILNSGGLGTMGYALPASIGAYFADSDNKSIAIMGDGGLQMNIQELQMISEYKIPIKVIVLKNNSLGLIRDIHEKYYSRRYIGSVKGFSVPALDKIASAYGMNYKKIIDYTECNGLSQIFEDDKAWMIVIELNGNTYVRPELLGLDRLDKQSPYLEETDR